MSFAGQAAFAQDLKAAQIKQIEGIAQDIANRHNANEKAMLDDMTVSTHAIASGRNVRFDYVLRVKSGLSAAKLKEFADATKHEIVPRSCAANAKNPAFDRGLTYTFAYTNSFGDSLVQFTVDKAVCKGY